MTHQITPPTVKKIPADLSLQTRVGSGPLDQNVVAKAEQAMKDNNTDFAPLALEYLGELEAALQKHAANGFADTSEAIAALTAPVMQLKANSKTFGYSLIGDLAHIMLGFIEAITTLDQTVIEIVSAHHRTLHAIVVKQIKGDGGAYGGQLQTELTSACQRYLSKAQKKPG